jgi:RimJ/RimL family protein N-acetyltransferase
MRSWPLFDLRVTTDRLTLRVATDGEVDALAQRAVGRVLPAAHARFMGPWTQLPSPAFERGMLQYHWSLRSAWTPQDWRLQLGIFPEGATVPIGMMDIGARGFAQTRSVSTGSWMLPDHRGAGLGREARRAALSFAFDALGAQEARSSAHPDNGPSLRISRSLGYRDDGTETLNGERGGIRLLLDRADWTAQPDVGVHGLDRCRDMFGL